MLSTLSFILGKIIDIVLKRADLKKNEAGPLKLYHLYLTLREMIVNAKMIERDLNKTIENPHRPLGLKFWIEDQIEAINKFCDLLWELMFYIEIFERDIELELARIAGIKFMILRRYYATFCRLDSDNLLLKSWDVSNSFEQLMHYSGGNARELESESWAEYDLSNTEHLIRLRDQAQENIASMEMILQKLGDFIKTNCELKDLFAAKVLPRWRN